VAKRTVGKRREFLMLAHTLRDRDDISGYWWSEKLDGMRCFWDGGISGGWAKSEVPWANTAKDDRYREEVMSTGLWSRLGNTISAPSWWLEQLPPIMLDGELWSPTLSRQQIMSIVKRLDGDERWRDIQYRVYDSPPPVEVFGPGYVNTPMYVKDFGTGSGVMEWAMPRVERMLDWYAQAGKTVLRVCLIKAQNYWTDGLCWSVHDQHELGYGPLVRERLAAELDRVVAGGGEGLMVRSPDSVYECKRSWRLLKVKKRDDMEGVVVGWTSGRETDRGSKHLGKMGALVLGLTGGIGLEVAGFTDAERELTPDAASWALENPGVRAPDGLWGPRCFELGSRVTFKYRGLSDDGVPQEAQYWRKDERV
jgi:DNA ligase-1